MNRLSMKRRSEDVANNHGADAAPRPKSDTEAHGQRSANELKTSALISGIKSLLEQHSSSNTSVGVGYNPKNNAS